MSLLDQYKHFQYKDFLQKSKDFFASLSAKLQSVFKIGSESSHQIRRRQFLLGGGLALGASAFAYAVMSVLCSQEPVQKQETTSQPVTTNIATATKQIDMGEARWNNLDDSIKTLRQQVAEIAEVVYENTNKSKSDALQAEERENQTQQFSDQDRGQSLSVNEPFSNAQTSLQQDNLETSPPQANRETGLPGMVEMQQNSQTQAYAHLSPGGAQNSDPIHRDSTHSDTILSGAAHRITIQKNTINLMDLSLIRPANNHKTVETMIPAGAFAKTVLLSGLDASSAMNASSDPRPMLLRIVDHGTLPRRFQSDLKDCHCTAGAYGDLSSERVYARLEKLTCIDRATGEIVEAQVSGYVSGSDGKAGIRGIVASKDGQFLARSLMGGVFAGLSNVANPQNLRAQVNPFFGTNAGTSTLGAQLSGPSIGGNFISGMAGGATTALDRLSQYYIDRAEQLQPVIQIAAGQVVDIVFTDGASLRNQCCSDPVLQRQETTNNKGN